jgi:hypothetical protein
MSELEDLLATLSGGGWSNNPTFTITLPSNAGPGQARIVIGSPLPPPLTTYHFASAGGPIATAGIIFYQGTPADNDYTFLVIVKFPGELLLKQGSVLAGAVIECDPGTPGFPAGQSWGFTGTPTARITLRGIDTVQAIEIGNPFSTTWVPIVIDGNVTMNGIRNAQSPRLIVAGNLVTTTESTFNANLVGLTTVSAVYVDVTGATLNISKQYDTDSRLGIDVSVQAFSTAINTVAQYGVNINGVDYDITNATMNVANQRQLGVGFRDDVAVGLAVGTYAVQLRWKRTAGAGTLSISNDAVSIRAREIAT